jgi:3(or 17)beta-hydroxysteroid dehydrogenase
MIHSGRFVGKVAIVTGAGSGIGRACATRLHQEGARVILADIDPATAEVSKMLPESLFLQLDVAEAKSWTEACEKIRSAFGHLNILINSAGITLSGLSAGIETGTLEDARRINAINVEGLWIGIQRCAPLLRAEGGAIVNIGSRAGEIGVPYAPAYAASKAALVSYTKSAALYFAREPRPIRCNAIHAGSIDTPMWRPLATDGSVRTREEALAAGLTHIPMQRLGRAEEIAAAALFLASDDASYITGATLNVDGGQCAQ